MVAEGSPKVYYTDSGKHFSFHVSCFRIAVEPVEEATYRVFKISDISFNYSRTANPSHHC